ncbi:MAG: transketolase [Actinomycetia bacterium]|nr:transketolase [Actinomycetes bacterium]
MRQLIAVLCLSTAAGPGQPAAGHIARARARIYAVAVVNDGAACSGVLERGREAGDAELARRADWIRLKTVGLIAQAGLGHYSSTFSCAEIIATLYYSVLRLDPAFPGWPDRDRFLLGKGHVATGLWPVLADLGYYPSDWLRQFGTVGSPLNDHPNMKLAPGIDFSSGALGHNLSVGAGMAYAGRLARRDYRVFVLTGDGELQEGQVWEAAMAASHYKLGNLVAIIDANGFSGSGPTSEAMNIEPLAGRFEAFGWLVREIEGHDIPVLRATFDSLPDPVTGPRPVAVIARTQKGHGADMFEKQPQAWHLGLLTDEQRTDVEAEIAARMELLP